MSQQTAPIPPYQAPAAVEPSPQPGRSHTALWIVALVVALLVGLGLGYAAGIPAKNDQAAQKTTAQQDAATARSELTTSKAKVDELNASVAKLQPLADKSSRCEDAATKSKKLVDEYQNLYQDWQTFLTSSATNPDNPSSADVATVTHIMGQFETMNTEATAVQQVLTTCVS